MTKGNILPLAMDRLLPAVAVLLSLTVGSCTVDDPSGEGDGQPVIVTAYAAESALTRSVEYVDHGDVTSGTYYLTYPQNGSSTNFAEVKFNDSPYGEATVMPGRGPLTWKQIGNGNTDRSLGLTNVSPAKHNNYNENKPYNNPIVFREDETQFIAGRYIPYGDEEHTNDILLANKSQYREVTTQDHTSNYVHFELHHCMSRVRVIVETHPREGSFDPLDGLLEKAKVDITNVVLKPYSFRPYMGDKTSFADAVTLCPAGKTMEEHCKFETINLLNTLDENAEDREWAETGLLEDQASYPGGQYFTTYDILLPPQQLRTDENRPRLRITVKDNEKGTKIYSGVLPHIMFNDKDNPLQFEFLAEHLLTIRTVISNNPPELIFMPVKVVDWVDKDRFGLEAKQAGIYDDDDFLEMIECYADYNETKLRRYGVFKNDRWTFEIFRNLSLDKTQIEEKMKVEEGKADYSFNFNTWFSVKVGDREYTEQELKQLLSGNTESL